MTIIITGASSGIGEALALICGAHKHNVTLVGRRTELLNKVSEQVVAAGGNVLVVTADVTVEADCTRVVSETISRFGAVDVLVNNAGQGHISSVEDTTTDMFSNMMKVNLHSTFWLTQAVLPLMREQNSGHIIAVSSVAGRIAYPFNAAYVAAKHAVVGFIAGLRTELTGTNINATVICPAGVTTEWSSATQGGNIGELFGTGISYSRTIAREQELPLAPLSKMMSSHEAAEILYNTMTSGRSNDVFTHEGTKELAEQAVSNRIGLENTHTALYLGMIKAYNEGVGR